MKVAGLFAGIGGFELGMAAAGHSTSMLCEICAPARAVLSRHIRRRPSKTTSTISRTSRRR